MYLLPDPFISPGEICPNREKRPCEKKGPFQLWLLIKIKNKNFKWRLRLDTNSCN